MTACRTWRLPLKDGTTRTSGPRPLSRGEGKKQPPSFYPPLRPTSMVIGSMRRRLYVSISGCDEGQSSSSQNLAAGFLCVWGGASSRVLGGHRLQCKRACSNMFGRIRKKMLTAQEEKRGISEEVCKGREGGARRPTVMRAPRSFGMTEKSHLFSPSASHPSILEARTLFFSQPVLLHTIYIKTQEPPSSKKMCGAAARRRGRQGGDAEGGRGGRRREQSSRLDAEGGRAPGWMAPGTLPHDFCPQHPSKKEKNKRERKGRRRGSRRERSR